MPNRSEVLAIIDSSDDPDRKEAKLRALGGGAAFRYVLKDIFPSLRRSEYKIDYTVREFTVDEGREIIKTRPQQLSLGEMFAVANSYEIGSDEYNNVFDIAVRMFPNDPVANLNAANIAMGKGDYASAKNYLAKAGNAPEAVHAKGVLSMLTGDLTEAESLLKQAQDMGVKAAAINLEELRKKIEDNAVFDSFNAVASDVVELVLPHEVDNPNNVYLYLEGDAWCAYERSAYYLTQMEVSVVLKKEVIHDDYDVVLLKAFFAVNDMYLPLSPTAVLKLVADDKLQFQIRDRVEGFSEWKENELKKLSA